MAKWTKWEHVMFYEKWGAGVPARELMVKTNMKTGLNKYKSVRIGDTSHGFAGRLSALFPCKSEK